MRSYANIETMDFPTPLTVPEIEIKEPILDKAGVQLVIRREDQNHPQISGNKFWKLKYNLIEAAERGYSTILTFGGAFSNHIAATAAACKLCGFHSIGIIRGEDADLNNPTLATAQQNGMLIRRVSRADYRLKITDSFITHLSSQFGNFYLIPEGGTNLLAIKGAEEMTSQIRTGFDYLCLPVGTGGTVTGCIQALRGQKDILGFSALKGSFMATEVSDLHDRWQLKPYDNWRILNEYHCGGYGKVTPELINFIRQFEKLHSVPLDQVYMGKMMLGLYKTIQQGVFNRGETIMALHTGGLQGRKIYAG